MSLNGFSQKEEIIHLWPDQVPGETEAKHTPVKTDNSSGNVTRITDITDPALVIFPASADNNNGAGVIVCPGGGYSILAIDKEGYEVAEWLNTLGFNAFVLQYRVPQKQEKDVLSCQPDFALLIYPASLDKGENRSLTSELEVNKNTPPMFIFGAADDQHSNSALVMTTSLRDKKVPVEFHLLSKGGHGYGLRSGNIAAETWPKLAGKWLKNQY